MTTLNSIPPIRALLVTGGFYHDFSSQSKIITEGISARANVEWAVFHDPGKTSDITDPTSLLEFFSNPDWSKGFDVVFYNECFKDIVSLELIHKKLAPHRVGLPAVVLHGTVHTHVALKSDEWREFIGVRSPKHGARQAVVVKNGTPGHPIMQDFPLEWDGAINEEVYEAGELMPGATSLATAYDKWLDKDFHIVWTNLYGSQNARLFGTSLAHHNVTFQNPVFLDLLTRGLLWTVDQLNATYLHPAKQVMLDGSKIESTFQSNRN